MPDAATPLTRPWGITARPVLCAGMNSSGSTWLFNVAAACLRSRGGAVLSFYADRLPAFPDGAEAADYLVIKTHLPSDALLFLARFAQAPVFLTLREPRDAAASLMRRFGHSFDLASRAVIRAAERTVALSRNGPVLLRRYEDRFYDREESVAAIADALGLTLSAADARRIFATYTRDQVNAAIAELRRGGAFGPDAHPDRFDPATHWHPGHVGDLAIGKYDEMLSPEQQAEILDATAEYRRVFDFAG